MWFRFTEIFARNTFRWQNNRKPPRKNDKSGESYYTVDNEKTEKNSDSTTKSETSNLDSKTNKPSTPININFDKCVCSCHIEVEQLISKIFPSKHSLKKR